MTGLSSLWLPILLSAVFVFVASSLIHMLLPWHKSDYKTLPNEERAMDALRALAIPPGDYIVPRPSSREDMRSAAFDDKLKKGPVMVLTVMPSGPMPMGRIMGFWFVYCLAMGVLAAYVTGRALPPGTPYLRVFRFAGATAFIGYSAALWQMAIWYRRSLTTTVKSTIDGLIYGLLTAGAFGWLWPR
jgi:ABC-type amino acid transport system permease subunit